MEYTFLLKDTATIYYQVTVKADSEEEALDEAIERITSDEAVNTEIRGDNTYAVAASYEGCFEQATPEELEFI